MFHYGMFGHVFWSGLKQNIMSLSFEYWMCAYDHAYFPSQTKLVCLRARSEFYNETTFNPIFVWVLTRETQQCSACNKFHISHFCKKFEKVSRNKQVLATWDTSKLQLKVIAKLEHIVFGCVLYLFQFGGTALHWAAESKCGGKEKLSFLIENGALVNAKNKVSAYPLIATTWKLCMWSRCNNSYHQVLFSRNNGKNWHMREEEQIWWSKLWIPMFRKRNSSVLEFGWN